VLQDGTEELLVSAVAQEQKVNRVAQFALAGLAAVYMVAAPAAQAATVKQVLCASNPTSKVRRSPLLSLGRFAFYTFEARLLQAAEQQVLGLKRSVSRSSACATRLPRSRAASASRRAAAPLSGRSRRAWSV
jgi:hypothetical protein